MAKTIKTKSGNIKINIDKLKSIEAQLGIKYSARVGILGASPHARKESVKTKEGLNKPGKNPSVLTNAEIGLKHEKGVLSENIPRRSFLMMPLELKFSKYTGAVGQSVMKGLTAENIKFVYKNIGIIAEGIIQRAFATRGFGKWKPNAPLTIALKGSDAPLIDTAQLRKSITSTVVTR